MNKEILEYLQFIFMKINILLMLKKLKNEKKSTKTIFYLKLCIIRLG